MLMKIDELLLNVPSIIINKVTLGSKGSSLCGRLYLYNRYISDSNFIVKLLLAIIDGIENNHCERSARHWRLNHKKNGCYFPRRYKEYL